jgi:hypothetical protein
MYGALRAPTSNCVVLLTELSAELCCECLAPGGGRRTSAQLYCVMAILPEEEHN